jgi:hypothetical protein
MTKATNDLKDDNHPCSNHYAKPKMHMKYEYELHFSICCSRTQPATAVLNDQRVHC